MTNEAIDRKKYDAYHQAKQLLDSLGYVVISKKEYDHILSEMERLKNELSIKTLENIKGSSTLDDMRSEIDRLRSELLSNKVV